MTDENVMDPAGDDEEVTTEPEATEEEGTEAPAEGEATVETTEVPDVEGSDDDDEEESEGE